MAVLLEAVGVTKRFGSLVAVSDVSFTLEQGEILGLIGPNGAGKTTLVNAIAGSAPGWSGEIQFRGSSLRRMRPHRIARLGIARSLQIAQPFAEMSVIENVMVGALYGSSARRSTADSRRLALEVLERVGLAGKQDAPSDELNGPERKRLELAKALATRPSLLLLDEAMAGLTPIEIEQAADVIRNVREQGVAILMIEHVMRAITSLADRVMVLHHGVKIVEGRPEDVLRNEQVVAAYLGARRLPD
jgi:branched-chain amino acid transport system ATP-binding protein